MLTHLQMAISLMPPCCFYLHTSPGLLTLRSHSYLTKTSLRYADQSAMLRFFGNLIPLKVVMIAHKICVNCLRQLCDLSGTAVGSLHKLGHLRGPFAMHRVHQSKNAQWV